MSDRVFLFLQGPAGPFFRLLGEKFRKEGYRVLRVNFNGGDLLDWFGPDTFCFRGTAADFPSYLAGIWKDKGVTDLVVYGDCRPLHGAAIDVLSGRGVRIHVFEEGYLRPDWVTLERNGVNGYSGLPATPSFYRNLQAPDVATRPAGSRVRIMAVRFFLYYLFCVLLSAYFTAYRTHRPVGIVAEAVSWVKRLPMIPSARWRARSCQGSLLESGRRFFVLALQLESDSQIRAHSRFLSQRDILEHVISSFARSGQRETMLVVKNHPLDSGLADHRESCLGIAERYGVSDRVLYLDGGHWPSLVKTCAGVVTVNSTTGLSSLYHGRPTCVLGKAFYDIRGLTHQAGLDSFWSLAEVPDPALCEAFLRYVKFRTQWNGSFYSRRGMDMLLEGLSVDLCRSGNLEISENNDVNGRLRVA